MDSSFSCDIRLSLERRVLNLFGQFRSTASARRGRTTAQRFSACTRRRESPFTRRCEGRWALLWPRGGNLPFGVEALADSLQRERKRKPLARVATGRSQCDVHQGDAPGGGVHPQVLAQLNADLLARHPGPEELQRGWIRPRQKRGAEGEARPSSAQGWVSSETVIHSDTNGSQESCRRFQILHARCVRHGAPWFCGVETKTMTTLPHSEAETTLGLVRPRYVPRGNDPARRSFRVGRACLPCPQPEFRPGGGRPRALLQPPGLGHCV